MWSSAGVARTASAHYAVQTDEWILSLPVAGVLEKSATLLLWATNPHLPVALQVIERWGFIYKTMITWVKMSRAAAPRIGLGYHARGATEHLLIAQRGGAHAPEASIRPATVIFNPIGRHSAKPDRQYEIAEGYGGPYVELFARPRPGLFHPRAGWTFLGNEVNGRDMREELLALAARDPGEGNCDTCGHPLTAMNGALVGYVGYPLKDAKPGEFVCPPCAAAAGIPPDADPPEDGTEDAARWLEEHEQEPDRACRAADLCRCGEPLLTERDRYMDRCRHCQIRDEADEDNRPPAPEPGEPDPRYLGVACRCCKAEPGQPCRNARRDFVGGVHAVRRNDTNAAPAPICEGERIAWLAKSGAPAEGIVRGLGVGGDGEGYSVEKAGDPPGRRVWVARDAEELRRVEENEQPAIA